MKTEFMSDSDHGCYVSESGYYENMVQTKMTARLDEIEDPSGKVLLFEGMGVWMVDEKRDWARETICVPTVIFAASDSPVSYSYHNGMPEDHSTGSINNHHGYMSFLHDDDEDVFEGYQLPLFADGHVEKVHEWWMYLNAPVISSVKGKGFTPNLGNLANGIAINIMKIKDF